MLDRKSRIKGTALTAGVILSMLLSVTLLMPAFIGVDAETDQTRLWGRVVDSSTEKVLNGAKVTITNLQTGEEFTIVQEDGSYRLDDEIGYFSIDASFAGYQDSGMGHMGVMVLKGEIKKVMLELVEVNVNRTISGHVGYLNGTGNATGITNATVDLYCTAGGYIGHHDSMLTDNGSYEFDVIPGTYMITVSNDGNMTQVEEIEVTNSDKVVDFTMEDGDVVFEIYGYAQDTFSSDIVEGIEVTVFDTMYSRQYNGSFATDYFQMDLYPSTFTIFVDAVGYKPYVKEGIVLNASQHDMVVYADLEDDEDESLEVTFTVNKEFDILEVCWDHHLTSDSYIPILGDGAGNPKMKIDEKYGDNNGVVNTTELNKFKMEIGDIGPASLYTGDIFMVNNTEFGPDFDGDDINFTVLLTNFNGAVDNLTDMQMKTTMIYVIEEDIESEEHFTVWLGDLEVDYNIVFHQSYEIVTGENDDWAFNTDNQDEPIPYEAVVYNSTTLDLKKKEKPVANITVTINGEVYYSDDEIYAGSASDEVVSKDDFENITFDATGSEDMVGRIVNYTWDFGDGSMGYGDLVTHNFTVAADATETFDVTLTLTDSAGETNGLEGSKVQITVDATAPALDNVEELIETLPGERNQSQRIQFNASKFTDDTDIPDVAGNYIWAFEDGSEVFGKTVSHVFLEAGKQVVELTVKDRVGNKKVTSLNINIRDTEAPFVNILGNLSIQAGEKLLLNATECSDNVADLANLTLLWDFNDTQVNTMVNNRTTVFVEPVFTNPGTYTIKLNVTDKAGNTGVGTKVITVTAADLIIDTFEVSDSKPSEGEKIDINILVKNIGVVDAEGFDVVLYVDDAQVDSTQISVLAAGTEQAVNFTWKAKKGTHDLKVVVDGTNVIMEDNENNNERDMKVEGSEDSSYWPLIIVILLIVIAIVVFVILKKKRGL